MYWITGRLIKHIAFFLRVFQVLLLFYTILFFIYWLFEMTGFSLAYLFAPLFKLPQDFVNWIFVTYKWNIQSKFSIFLPKMFIACVLSLLILILSNFIFMILGSVERFFVEKSYEKGEKDHDILK